MRDYHIVLAIARAVGARNVRIGEIMESLTRREGTLEESAESASSFVCRVVKSAPCARLRPDVAGRSSTYGRPRPWTRRRLSALRRAGRQRSARTCSRRRFDARGRHRLCQVAAPEQKLDEPRASRRSGQGGEGTRGKWQAWAGAQKRKLRPVARVPGLRRSVVISAHQRSQDVP